MIKTALIVSYAVANLIFIPWLFFWCFGSIQGFFQSIFYYYKPDWLSWLDGSLAEDFENEFKGFLFWAGLAGVFLLEGFLWHVLVH